MKRFLATAMLVSGFTGLAVGQAHALDENPIFFETQPTTQSRSADPAGARPAAVSALARKIDKRGHLRVIAQLKMSAKAAAGLSSERSGAKASLKQVQAGVIARVLKGKADNTMRRFQYGPFVALSVDSAALKRLIADREVVSIQEDAPLYADAIGYDMIKIKAPPVWRIGERGTGQVVAVLDTGVQTDHPMLAGKTVSEACYSTSDRGNTASVCPGGVQSSTGPHSAEACEGDDCNHGTHVAGTAVGKQLAEAQGVANYSKLIAIQVFHHVLKAAECDGRPLPCAQTSFVDVEAGLERVYALRNKYKIAALNMSLGGGRYTGTCDAQAPSIAHIMKLLTNAGIANVVATGNAGFKGAVGAPACISSAIAVGSTGPKDVVSDFSNHSKLVALMAPGEDIVSALPGNKFSPLDGTSMAAPHVAGAFALLRQMAPHATVAQILKALEVSGTAVTRDGITSPRIDLLGALNTLTPIEPATR